MICIDTIRYILSAIKLTLEQLLSIKNIGRI